MPIKYPNIILTIIAIVLIFIAWRLLAFEAISVAASQNNHAVVDSNQALINAIQRLETNLNSLRQELVNVRVQLPRK